MNNLMRRSGIVALLCLVLCMMLVITACDGNGDETTGAETTEDPEVTTDGTTTGGDGTTEEPTTDDSTTEEPVAKVTYTVTVTDVDGNAIAGARVQICVGETCIPGITDANGVATIEAVEEVYQASVTKADGYVVDSEVKYDLTDNAVTIKLEKAPAVVVPGDAIVITGNEELGTAEEPLELELAANGSVVYSYTAATAGKLTIYVEGVSASTVINNVTSGKNGVAVPGTGSIAVNTVAGSTYEIVVSSTEAATIKVYIEVENEGDGTKENPYVITDAQNFKANLEAGKTVWYKFVGVSAAINNPAVKVNYNGTLYPSNASGERAFTVVEIKEYDPTQYVNVYDRTELLLNGNVLDVIATDEAAEASYVLGLSAEEDMSIDVVMRDGSEQEAAVVAPSAEGPFTLAPGQETWYVIPAGTYTASGWYYILIDGENTEGVGFPNYLGSVDAYDNTSVSPDYDKYIQLKNTTDEVVVVKLVYVEESAVVGNNYNPAVVEVNKIYAVSDYATALVVGNNRAYFKATAPANGYVTLVNKGTCECTGWSVVDKKLALEGATVSFNVVSACGACSFSLEFEADEAIKTLAIAGVADKTLTVTATADHTILEGAYNAQNMYAGMTYTVVYKYAGEDATHVCSDACITVAMVKTPVVTGYNLLPAGNYYSAPSKIVVTLSDTIADGHDVVVALDDGTEIEFVDGVCTYECPADAGMWGLGVNLTITAPDCENSCLGDCVTVTLYMSDGSEYVDPWA